MDLFEQAKQKLGSHNAVARTLGVPRRTYYDWRTRPPKYEGHRSLIEFALRALLQADASALQLLSDG